MMPDIHLQFAGTSTCVHACEIFQKRRYDIQSAIYLKEQLYNLLSFTFDLGSRLSKDLFHPFHCGNVPRLFMIRHQISRVVNTICDPPGPSQNGLPWQLQFQFYHYLN